MQAFKTTILITSLAALAGCANWDKSSIASLDKSPICPKTHEWQAWSDVRCNPPEAPKGMADNHTALEKDRQRLADDLAASQRQLADRDRELASLRSENGDSARLASQLSAANSERDRLASRLAAMESGTGDKEKLAAELASAKQRVADLERQLAVRDASLAKAEKDLLKSLQPEISKGTVSVHQSGNALTINLASGLLFDSGQDQLKSGGTDALKRVGSVLKDFPDKQVHVAGYTDNVAIKGALQKKFPSNKELSDARANSAAQALRNGGVSTNLSAAGHGNSNPIASNNTDVGRAKNRRVEIIVS